MSIEAVGPSGSYVYISEDGLNGFSRHALNATRVELGSSNTNLLEMISALDDVLAHGKKSKDVGEDLERGRFLLAACDQGPMQGTNIPPDALLYAEAEGKTDQGAFSVVRMGTWIYQNRRSPRRDDDELRADLIKLAFSDLDDPQYEDKDWIWGIPVAGDTRIAPFHPTEDEDPEGYVFGHQRDLAIMNELGLPKDLKRMATNLTDLWWKTRQSDAPQYLKDSFLDVRARL